MLNCLTFKCLHQHIQQDTNIPRNCLKTFFSQYYQPQANSRSFHHTTSSHEPEFRIFFIEVPGYPVGALPNSQDLGGDFVALPLSPPGLARGRGGDLGVQVQLVDVDALVPGEGRGPGAGLQAQPALVFELPLAHVLAEFHCAVWRETENKQEEQWSISVAI